MAVTATLISVTGTPFPFIGVGVAAAQYITSIPSAELVFTEIGGVIAVAAGAASQSLEMTCALPNTFCWVMVECSFRITSTTGANWDNEAVASLQDSIGTPAQLIPVVARSSNLSHLVPASAIRTYDVRNVPTKLIVPSSGDAAEYSIFVSNTTVDGAAGTVDFYARFLRYDRNQAQFWPINTPALIR